MRIAIFGAGSIGCFVGGAWASRGADVTLIGRPHVGDELVRHGLKLSAYDGWSTFLPPDAVRFTSDAAALAGADIIVLTVKSVATEIAARDIAHHARLAVPVVSVQNGVANAERLRALLPGHTILAGMVPYNVARLGDGRWHKGTKGDLVMDAGPVGEALRAIAGPGPAALRLSADMPSLLWGKLVINLNNAVNALSGLPLRAQLRQRGYRRVVAAAQREMLILLAAADIRPAKVSALPPSILPYAFAAPDWLFNGLLLHAHKVDATARSSMADDFAAGRATEIDYLNGGVVALARRIGKAAPVNARIVGLVRDAERGGRRDWNADALQKAVLT
ncbi:2-dehydropantoate 2-reductase [Allosphingosinicella vermicomposti]|uniref:2-dehydropantoate 2-reductase n=1 Tax=Allosphingosinicella vermicomposti TaxID=614671 RepID=UPI000D102AB6|nr:2-dehydropantoate 2-reductase [Allosphingosinicella vermicomposti]